MGPSSHATTKLTSARSDHGKKTYREALPGMRLSSLLLIHTFLIASALSGQTFTVDGAGAGPVDLPQPLTDGQWFAELESFNESRDLSPYLPTSQRCSEPEPRFAIESKVHRLTEGLTRTEAHLGGTFTVGVRDFPAGAAQVQVRGSLVNSPDPSADPNWRWTLRFTKDGTPKPPAKDGDTFVVHGRGSPLEVALPAPLTEGMWRVDLQTYKDGRPFGVYVAGGDFYLSSDRVRHCRIVRGIDNRTRIHVGRDVAAGEALLLPRQIQPDVLWSVRFTKDGTPLLPDPPSPPEDCPNDSACETPDPEAPEPPPSHDTCPATRACLNQAKFWVNVDYYEGYWKAATVLKEANLPDTAALFWFFDPNNPELLVKVLNGCAINGHWWVYGSAATDRNYEVTVRRPNQTGLRFRRISPAVPIAYTTGIPCLSGE